MCATRSNKNPYGPEMNSDWVLQCLIDSEPAQSSAGFIRGLTPSLKIMFKLQLINIPDHFSAMIAGYLQFAPQFGEKEMNFDTVAALAKDIKADLLVLPELFATGYAFTCEDEVQSMSEQSKGPTALFLAELAGMTGAIVAGGFIESDGASFYNSMLISDSVKILGTYRKLHLFNKEKLWFTPGNRPPRVIETPVARLGPMICFDWIFPEMCRTLALQGAQVIVHPSNLVLPWAQRAIFARCVENRVFAVTANRIGREQRGSDDFTFTGGSQIMTCTGEILSSAPMDQPFVGLAEFDPKKADQKMINPFNDLLGDRRTEFYIYD